MEILKVEEFLIIKKSYFEVKRVNIIIGPQANGKSLLAKLLYFFREIIRETFLKAIENNYTKREFIKEIITSFEKYFPKYLWRDKNIDIKYIQDEIEIKILKNSTQRVLKVEFSKYFTSKLSLLKNRYKRYLEENKNSVTPTILDFFNFQREYMNKKFPYLYDIPIFIPASRSFFANLQKNIFSFLSNDINIDPFIKEFGAKYEIVKEIYAVMEEDIKDKIKISMEKILNGKYKYNDNQDWIEEKDYTINISNASSGQQESLPMLLILSTFPFIKEAITTFFIEEPEAHLFPVSQKHIMELIGLVYNNSNDIVITTHSPYILVALNNLFLGFDVMKKRGEEAIKEIIDKDFCINFDDVSGYTINNGELESILDRENRLIGTNIIDSVSDEFNATFDNLLSLED